MIKRRIEEELKEFFVSKDKRALLVTGARQVGKTFIIEQLGKSSFARFIKIDFIENKDACGIFDGVTEAEALLLRISALGGEELIPGETLIFLDEVQECREIVTAIKFLAEDGRYKYILSGSLLGVELRDIRSMPVGFMDIIQMYPLDIEEFARANGVSDRVLDALKAAFEKCAPVDEVIHKKMMELFRLYLIVGGMPAAVDKYLETNDLRSVVRIQSSIVNLYKKDIAKYDPESKLYLEEIFDLIPSELNAKNKRFILKNLNENFKFSRYSNSFLWLKDAGTALPVYCVDEPEAPLTLSKSTNLFKLFLADVGLLASMYMNDIQIKILRQEKDINFGAVYENAAAQELAAHGYSLYYFNSKKQGEIDFLIEDGGDVVPMEIKSGKDYSRHAALSNVLQNPKYDIPMAYVFYNGNIKTEGKITYLPMYMLMFIRKKTLPEKLIYNPDFSILRG